MSAARAEPFAEHESPTEAMVNAMADVWEAQTRLLIDNGGAALVRARLARLLPTAPCGRLPAGG